MSKTTSARKTVAVTSDTASMVNALRATFSCSTTFIAELMQNARRAGSESVHFVLSGDENRPTLTIQDQGCGISDFSVLLSMCRSGWDDAVKKSDSPYGLGLFSSFFACEEVTIESLGHGLSASSEALLHLRPVEVVSIATFSKGTSISLFGLNINADSIKRAIVRYAKGFSISVFLNDVELERPHALDADSYSNTPIGLVYCDCLFEHPDYCFYLQGLPISHEDYHSRHSGSNVVPVHLDSTVFFGRMPDRSHVIKKDGDGRRIRESLLALQRDLLREEAKRLPGPTFVAKYASLCIKLDLVLELLNPIAYIPAGWLSSWWGNSPTMYEHDSWTTCFNDQCRENGVISRSELGEGVIYRPSRENENDCIQDVYAVASARPMVNTTYWRNSVEGYWFSDLIKDLLPHGHGDDDTVTYSIESVGNVYQGRMSSSYISADLVISDQVVLTHPEFGPVTLPASLGVYCEGSFYLSKDSHYDVIGQASDFLSGNDDRDDHGYDEAENAFLRAFRFAINPDPVELLTSFILPALPAWDVPEVLKGNRFTLAFDSDGKFSVVKLEDASVSDAVS